MANIVAFYVLNKPLFTFLIMHRRIVLKTVQRGGTAAVGHLSFRWSLICLGILEIIHQYAYKDLIPEKFPHQVLPYL